MRKDKKMLIRFAKINDCEKILKIYNQYISTPITFEYALPTKEDFTKRIASIGDFYPYLVCEKNKQILAYAYAHRHMQREAYQWNAELSIYLDKLIIANGLGKKLYNLLIEILKLQGIKTVYGCVTIPNTPSEKLHEKLGFQTVGIYHKAGYKDNKWQDVKWFEKTIAPYDDSPQPIISIKQIPEAKLQNILASL